jgi:hypothetical protein
VIWIKGYYLSRADSLEQPLATLAAYAHLEALKAVSSQTAIPSLKANFQNATTLLLL